MVISMGSFVALSALIGAIAWWANRPAPLPPEPTIEAYWTAFRGKNGNGITDMDVTFEAIDPKMEFSCPEEGWESLVKNRGNSSPILHGNFLITTGGSKTSRTIVARSGATGRIKWEAKLPLPPADKLGELDLGFTGYAAATPCTDGERVYAIFSDGTLGAVDFRGRIVWTKHLGPLDNSYGHSASLRLASGRLIVQLDQKHREDEKNDYRPIYISKLIGLDPANGDVIWETPRSVDDTWSSPIVINTKSTSLIVTATNPWVIASDAACGKEVWRAEVLTGEVGPSPVSDGTNVYVTMDGAGTTAIRTEGKGNITKTHVRWQNKDTISVNLVSPSIAGKYLVLVYGKMVECLDSTTGESLWKQSVGRGDYHASPTVIRNNRVLLVDTKGTIKIIEPGEKYKLCESFDLGEPVDGSPAFGANRIFIRGRRHIFCFCIKNNIPDENKGS